MSIYTEAALAVSRLRDEKQAKLDAAAAAARVAHVAAAKAALLRMLPPDHPQHAVCVLLAESLTIGRDDGYPAISYSDDAKIVAIAAAVAGLTLPIIRESNRGDLPYVSFDSPSPVERKADYEAWKAANDYREMQKRAPQL